MRSDFDELLLFPTKFEFAESEFLKISSKLFLSSGSPIENDNLVRVSRCRNHRYTATIHICKTINDRFDDDKSKDVVWCTRLITYKNLTNTVFSETTKSVASWKPYRSYKIPATVGPINAPSEYAEVQIPDIRAYVPISAGKPISLGWKRKKYKI